MTPATANLTTPAWTVLRHGGAARHKWRIVYEGAKDTARRVYAAQCKALDQGGVRLVSPGGKVMKSARAPRLRTRR